MVIAIVLGACVLIFILLWWLRRHSLHSDATDGIFFNDAPGTSNDAFTGNGGDFGGGGSSGSWGDSSGDSGGDGGGGDGGD